MSSLLFFLTSICATLPLASCQSLKTTNDELVIFATDPDSRIEFSPSSFIVWHPLVRDFNHSALTTNDPRASVSIIFQGSAVKFYCADGPNFPPLLATFDGKESNITPNQTIEAPSGTSTANHTVVLRKSPDASNESFWNVLAFGITPASDFPPPLATVIPPAVQHAYSPRAFNTSSNDIPAIIVFAILVDFIGVQAVVFGVGRAIRTWLRRRRLTNEHIVVTPNPLVVNRTTRNELFPQAALEGMGGGDRPRSSLQQLNSINIGSMTVEVESSLGLTRPPTYLSRDETTGASRGRPPTYFSQEDICKSIHPSLLIPFLSQLYSTANRVPMSEIRADEVLSRNTTLASVNPPPSYRSEDRSNASV